MNIRKTVLICISLFLPLIPVFSIDARAILEEASLLGNVPCAEYSVGMEIEQEKGSKTRQLEIYRDESGGAEKFLVQIVQPAFLKNMKLLSITQAGDQMRWLKTSRGVKRLSASSRDDQPLFDSDFSTSDLLMIDLDAYDLEITHEAGSAVMIRVSAKTGQDDRTITVDTAKGLVIQVDYLDAGKVYKQYTVLETQEVDNAVLPSVCSMVQLEEGTQTVLTFDSVELKDSIPSRYFNSSQL